MFRLLRGVLALAALALVFAPASFAYWFYQGNLPTSGGARAVHEFSLPKSELPSPQLADRHARHEHAL